MGFMVGFTVPFTRVDNVLGILWSLEFKYHICVVTSLFFLLQIQILPQTQIYMEESHAVINDAI